MSNYKKCPLCNSDKINNEDSVSRCKNCWTSWRSDYHLDFSDLEEWIYRLGSWFIMGSFVLGSVVGLCILIKVLFS